MENGKKVKNAEKTVEKTEGRQEMNEDQQLDRMSAEADMRVSEFEAEQKQFLHSIDADASQGGTSGLSMAEMNQARQETGIVAKLEALRQRAREMRDAFREKVLDRKVSKIVQEASYSRGEELNFSYTKLRQTIASLRTDQLRRHLEIISHAKKSIEGSLEREAKSGRHSVSSSYGVRHMGEVLDAFQNHPEVVAELLQNPELEPMQDKIFLECLYSPQTQHEAVKMAQMLRLGDERTKNLVIQAVKNTVNRKDKDANIHDYVYDFSRAISDFGIDKETIQSLALNYFKSIATGTYPWSLDERFKNNFHFSDQEVSEFVVKNQDSLISFVYQGAANTLRRAPHAGIVPGLFEHFKKHFQLKLDAETFKRQPENAQLMREVTLACAANATIAVNQEGFDSISSVPIINILHTPEGQEALYRGAQELIVQGKKVEEIGKFLNDFGLDIENVRSNPQTLESLRNLLSHDIKNYHGVWRSDLIKLLNINEANIGDLKIEAISTFIKQESYQMAFDLMDSISLSEEQEKNISKNIFGTEDKFSYLTTLRQLLDKRFISAAFTIFIREHERFSNKTTEQLEAYVNISQKIVDSPSQEMIRIKDQLIDQILATENPEQTYEVINNIFIQNNLPLVGKVERVFDSLYPDAAIKQKINSHSSPVLQEAKSRLRRNIIFQDLLKVHIESGNRSLKTFLTLLKDAEPLTEKLRQNGLSEQEQRKLGYILRKLKTLADVSLRGQQNEFPAVSGKTLLDDYDEICTQLGVKPGQKVEERVVDMFARPIGYENIDEILAEMQKSQQSAHQRSRQAIHGLHFAQGDLVKGVSIAYIDNILQNGSVAKEFLGASSDSDATPFDTDVEIIAGELKPTFQENHDALQHASGYGELALVIKDRGQFQKTSSREPAKYEKTKYELFQTGVLGANHFGVRTGFPCTEVDFMILRSDQPAQRENLFYSIAQNGYYIPVVDRAGQLLFTPELYDQYRKVFAGVEKYEGQDMRFASLKADILYPEVKSIVESKEVDNERLSKLKVEIRQLVLEVLSKYGIQLKGEYDDSLLGAELLDIGSTGRGTNAVGEGDFDFNLKLDAKDFDKVSNIAAEIVQRLGSEMKEGPIYPSGGNNNQLRFFGSNIFSQKGLDIDIGFVKKSDLNVYASHDAVADKLNNIRQKYGNEAYGEVVANILLAKKWLKEGRAYKKGNYGEGGLGGIGVENLILAYEGNIREAFGAFYRAAKNSDGSIKSLETFKQDFKILDAGMNLRFNNHDNFVYNMNEDGYRKMIAIIQEHGF